MRKQYVMTTVVLAMAAVVPMLAQTPFKPYPVSPRKIVIGKDPQITLCKDGKAAFEVVKPANPAAAKEALKELLLRLEQITGRKVVPVAKASGKVPAFYLGTCPEAEKLGLNPETATLGMLQEDPYQKQIQKRHLSNAPNQFRGSPAPLPRI